MHWHVQQISEKVMVYVKTLVLMTTFLLYSAELYSSSRQTASSRKGAQTSHPSTLCKVSSHTVAKDRRPNSDGLRLYCEYCMKSFTNDREMKGHYESYCNDGRYKCSYCYIMFSSKDARTEHIITHLGKSGKICELCGKGFRSPGGYSTHCKMFHGTGNWKRKYGCEVCGKVFAAPSRLATHKRSHSKEKGFYCDICKKSFKHKYYLQKHSCLVDRL